MPSKEHLALKFDICTILLSAQPDETVKTAGRILSTILAALQEPTRQMLDELKINDAFTYQALATRWNAALKASPLGEQSE